MAVYPTQGGVGSRQAGQTSEGSCSAVSTPIFTTKYLFCSIFRDLQDLQTFAPLQIQFLNCFCIFFRFLQNVAETRLKAQCFRQFLNGFFPELREIADN